MTLLLLLENEAAKAKAQSALQKTIANNLVRQGRRNIGFPSGNVDEIIYSDGEGQLWCAFSDLAEAKIPRRWNAFGVFDPSRHAQLITVEINVPTTTNSGVVAGFFSQDPVTRHIYLMHDGSVGGGRKGVGRAEFLKWSKLQLEHVPGSDGRVREGVVIGRVDTTDLPMRIWEFVRQVRGFKDAVKNGGIGEVSPVAPSSWGDFQDEGSGRRRGTRSADIDYVSYHGDVVRALQEELELKRKGDEIVTNSKLIDLCVASGQKLTEVYEVKTSNDRQCLYTAVGQLMIHGLGPDFVASRTLVIPEGPIPSDIDRFIAAAGIMVRRFSISGGEKPQVRLLGQASSPPRR